MKHCLFPLLACFFLPSVMAEFHVYLPSRATNQLWIVSATGEGTDLKLSVSEKVDLGFAAATITAHPEKPILYVSTNIGEGGEVPGATVRLDSDGGYESHEAVNLSHGYSYLSLDRKNRFLLGAYYRFGQIDVYPIDDDGNVGPRVAGLDEGRTSAHAVLTSPDNRFAYIPYVKDSNAILQYSFEEESGELSPLDPPNANPPEGTGPRHIAYHPTKPFVYFSNEQGLGASVYEKTSSGALKFVQSVDVIPEDEKPEGIGSASDCVITPDGNYLFTGQRSGNEVALYNAINRYRILEDGRLEHLGFTRTDAIPWGLALSPDAKFLLVTAFGGASLHAYEITKDGGLTERAKLPIDEKISDLVTK